MSIIIFSGTLRYPSSVAVLITFTMLLPSTTTLRPNLSAELITCCTRSTLEANVATIIRLFSLSANILSNVLPTVFSDIV